MIELDEFQKVHIRNGSDARMIFLQLVTFNKLINNNNEDDSDLALQTRLNRQDRGEGKRATNR